MRASELGGVKYLHKLAARDWSDGWSLTPTNIYEDDLEPGQFPTIELVYGPEETRRPGEDWSVDINRLEIRYWPSTEDFDCETAVQSIENVTVQSGEGVDEFLEASMPLVKQYAEARRIQKALDGLCRVGPRLSKRLYRHIGPLPALKQATMADLRAVKWLDDGRAAAIYLTLNQ